MNRRNTIPVHSKVWGEEHWIVNREYCGKRLVLKRGFRCSLHHHKQKDETFYVTRGRVLLELDGQMTVLCPGDAQHIPVRSPHRFTGLEDSEFIEFSTHHVEEDSYRSSASEKVPDDEFQDLLDRFTSPRVAA